MFLSVAIVEWKVKWSSHLLYTILFIYISPKIKSQKYDVARMIVVLDESDYKHVNDMFYLFLFIFE